MRALIVLVCGIAWADASLPADHDATCEAQIQRAAQQMTARGYHIFSQPIVSTTFDRIHVTFTHLDPTIAYIAIFPRARGPEPGWRHFADDPWSRWENQLGPWAAEIGYLKASREGLRLFVATFQPVADACLDDANHGSSLRNQPK